MAAAVENGDGKAHPFEAFVRTLLAFALCSLVFNVLVAAFFHAGLESLLGSVLFATIPIAIGCLWLFSVPISREANTSRRYRRIVVLAAGVAAFLIYLTALRYEARPVTDWLFPHVPGLDLTFSSFDIWVAAGALAGIFGVACLSVEEVPGDAAASAGDPLDVARSVAGNSGEEDQTGSEGSEGADFEADFG